jgi:two-component system response regulator QseB
VRRSSGTMDAAEHVWTAGAITVDGARMRVTRAGAPVTLSKPEFALLLALIKQPDRVLTRSELEKRALPHSDRQTLDVHIFNLRKKIGESTIRTVRGVGYTVQA